MRIFSYLKIALLLSLVELALAGARTREIALGKDDDMEFFESRARVLALIDSLRTFSPDSFRNNRPTPIPDAAVVIDGEPMNPFVNPPGGPPLTS